MNPPRHPANSYLFPLYTIPIYKKYFHESSCIVLFNFYYCLWPKKRTLGKVQIERYLDSFPYTSLSLRCCCSRFCRLVGARVPIHPQILADHLTLYQPGGAGYAHHITTGTPLNIKTFLRHCAAGSTKKKKVPFPSHGKNYYMVHTSA